LNPFAISAILSFDFVTDPLRVIGKTSVRLINRFGDYGR